MADKKYSGTNTLTAFWAKVKGTFAPLASPALTGTPTAPTASAGTNTTQIATTAFVKSAVPTNVSTFTNDAGYLTLSTLPTYDGSYTDIGS